MKSAAEASSSREPDVIELQDSGECRMQNAKTKGDPRSPFNIRLRILHPAAGHEPGLVSLGSKTQKALLWGTGPDSKRCAGRDQIMPIWANAIRSTTYRFERVNELSRRRARSIVSKSGISKTWIDQHAP
jgi:hypothetical protein